MKGLSIAILAGAVGACLGALAYKKYKDKKEQEELEKVFDFEDEDFEIIDDSDVSGETEVVDEEAPVSNENE